MSALENIYGVGYQVDAEGKPIERGFGNLTDRAKTAAAEAAVSQPVPEVANSATLTDETAAPAAPALTAGEALLHKVEEIAHAAEAAIAAEVAKL